MAHQIFNFSWFCLSQGFVWRSEVINNLHVYKTELMVVALAEWEQKCMYTL